MAGKTRQHLECLPSDRSAVHSVTRQRLGNSFMFIASRHEIEQLQNTPGPKTIARNPNNTERDRQQPAASETL